MKISNDDSIRTSPTTPIQPTALPGQSESNQTPYSSTQTPTPAAQVELSAEAKALSASKAEAAQYLAAVKAVPETRDDLVNKLKTQVESGSYHVTGTDIAEKILQRAAAERQQ